MKLSVLLFMMLFSFSKVNFSQTSAEFVQSGLNSYSSGDYSTALDNFNNALQMMNPEEGSDVPLASETQIEYDTESEEVEDTESTMEYDTESQETYATDSQIQTVDVSKVQEYADPLDYQGDNESNIYLYRGQTNLKLGNKEAALKDFDTAIQLDPSYSDAYFRRAVVNYQIDPNKVCPDLQTAINNGHQSAQELYNLICK